VFLERPLPEGAVVGLYFPGSLPAAQDTALCELHAEERTHSLRLSAVRRRTWIAGRLALHRAARLAAIRCGPVLSTERGAPALPEGVTGSISHKSDLAVAAIARLRGWTLGVDVERGLPNRLRIAPHALSTEEMASIGSLGSNARWEAVVRIFSLKEAMFKAVDSIRAFRAPFSEVTLRPSGRWPTHLGPTLRAEWRGVSARGRWETLPIPQTQRDVVLSVAWARKANEAE
jgi:4'-phosphopantetheinyl transferase EntD